MLWFDCITCIKLNSRPIDSRRNVLYATPGLLQPTQQRHRRRVKAQWLTAQEIQVGSSMAPRNFKELAGAKSLESSRTAKIKNHDTTISSNGGNGWQKDEGST